MQPTGPAPVQCEYAAFISYRHLPRDQEVARHVQHAIETFKMPRGVSGWHPGAGLGKCFRDEDELAAAHSLPDRILDALAKSSALIVVCTPDTRESVWVSREVEAFIGMHGRERVFAVLASGTSAESIPDVLKTPAPAGMAGGTGSAPTLANPLAADLRPEASAKSREETLRIIAAVAGCSFDDLKQRARARKRRQRMLAIGIAVLVVAAVVAAFMLASGAHRNAQIDESKRLAAESSALLEQGDRYGALEKALAALPKSGSSNDRPFVQEAQDALADALEIYPNDKSPWRACYRIETADTLGYIGPALTYGEGVSEDEIRSSVVVISQKGKYLAVSDDGGNVSTFDLKTGKKLADCVMPAEMTPLEGGLYVRNLAATENYLVVSHSGSTKGIACFTPETGELLWSTMGPALAAFDTSRAKDAVSMVTPLETGGYDAALIDLSEPAMAEARNEGVGKMPASPVFFTASGSDLGVNYAAFGDQLYSLVLDSGEAKQVALAHDEVTSLKYVGGMLVAASADPMPESGTDRQFAIEAFDENLNRLWRFDGVFAAEMLIDSGYSTLLNGEPTVLGKSTAEGGIAAYAGREALVLDSATGEVTYRCSFDQSVVGMALLQGPDPGTDLIYIACADGTITSKDRTGATMDSAGDSRRLILPFPIRWAEITDSGDEVFATVIPANSDQCITTFRTNFSRGKKPAEERSLDELITLANEILAEGGRA